MTTSTPSGNPAPRPNPNAIPWAIDRARRGDLEVDPTMPPDEMRLEIKGTDVRGGSLIAAMTDDDLGRYVAGIVLGLPWESLHETQRDRCRRAARELCAIARSGRDADACRKAVKP